MHRILKILLPSISLILLSAETVKPVSVNLEVQESSKNYAGFAESGGEVHYQPRHVHIAYGENSVTEMVITWSTIDKPPTDDDTSDSIVEYGFHSNNVHTKFLDQKAKGFSREFIEDGPMKLMQYIHRVTLKNLIPDTTYMYHCGSDFGWSELFYFTTMKNGSDWAPRFAVYGDLGYENAQSLGRLQREVQMNMYDAILHVGDFAYNFDTNDGIVGDSFMEQLQPIAAYLPYMTCPGNHESARNFSQYKKRFSMPGPYESMMYSWNIGPIHFISFSTEFYYYLQYGIKPLVNQYEWIEADLQEATKPENREKRPWIITYGHRPMYCSNSDGGDCTGNQSLVRVGLPYTHWFGLEDMFMKYGVDLTIWAHEHSYERLWPLYNHTVYNGSYAEPYKNPKALVHVTTGSAGCNGMHDPFFPNQPYWSAFRSADYGYSRLQILNKTHLYMEQVSDDQGGKVVDSFHVIREHHEPYKIPV